ncbi:MAG TPA: DinB family protein [Vicinamibacterales bacterium]|jgi:uncharacterized damage-inducible protein DinB
MNPMLRDLLDHLLWADAEHWRVIAAHPAAREDRVIRERLHHMHLVQHAWTWAAGDRVHAFIVSKPGEFPSLEALRAYARGSHDAIVRRRDELSDDQCEERLTLDWFTDPPLALTRTEALTQMAMHSQWHRGQNAARLRELGLEPPAVDLIVWWWKGRPSGRL